MNKDEVIYEFVDKYAYFACVGNIIIENYTMSDGEDVYKTMMQTFKSYLYHYNYIKKEVEAGTIEEKAASAAIKVDINWLRQKSFKGFVSVLQQCLESEYVNGGVPYDVEEGLRKILKSKPGYDINDADLQTLLISMRIAEEEFREKRLEGVLN